MVNQVEDQSVLPEIMSNGIVNLRHLGDVELLGLLIIEILLDLGPSSTDQDDILALPKWGKGYCSSSNC